MDKCCSNLWQVQNEGKIFDIQADYVNHLSKIKNSTVAIDNSVPFQPHHIYKLRYFEKCGYKKKQEHVQYINENLVQKIEDLQRTNIKYNKDFLINRVFDKKSLNFDARMNQVQKIMNGNVQIAKMIKNCKPSVQNTIIKKQSLKNIQYKQNILKNSKRIFNPHLNLHQMNKSISMTNFQFSEKQRQKLCKTPISQARSRVFDFRAQTVRHNDSKLNTFSSTQNKFFTTKIDNIDEEGYKKPKYNDDQFFSAKPNLQDSETAQQISLEKI